MHIPRLEPDSRGPRRTLTRAHTVDAAWTSLLLNTEFAPTLFAAVRDRRFLADARHLAVQCRRHVASARRAFDTGFPPYTVAAAKVAHP